MSYSYYPTKETWYNTYDLRGQALGLTALSLFLASMVAAFFVDNPVPFWVYLTAIVAEFVLIISMWFIRSPTAETIILF
ncbi:MAG: hypothetical protein ACFFCQ_17920, partial [Promethearchaeota archaeon]